MNIALKPTIPEFFTSSTRTDAVSVNGLVSKPEITARKQRREITTSELKALVELRALAVPYKEIALLLRRRSVDCSSAVFRHNLQQPIRNRRKTLIGSASDSQMSQLT
tara:strand:+ start:936 stop:1259 length:324 start_codon:yes stop_codon:yes gene_type:complete